MSHGAAISASMTARLGEEWAEKPPLTGSYHSLKCPVLPPPRALIPTAARHTITLPHLHELTCDRRNADFLDERELGDIAPRKLERIAKLGHDPWGSRFDDHAAIADIRERTKSFSKRKMAAGRAARYSGRRVPISISASGSRSRVPAKWTGPQVRAAGRIVLHRDKGKLKFIDIRDWTGQIQLFVGQQQGGRRSGPWRSASTWATSSASMANCKRTKTGELTIFAEQAALSHQVARAAAGKASRPDRSRTAAADALSRPDPTARACCRGF